MKMSRFSAVALIPAALILGSCGGDSPSQPSSPAAPPVAATPTPAPTATPSPLGNPPVRATARMFGYTRNAGSNQGRFPIPPAPAFFQIADWIDLDCTPRDADSRETRNHPPFAEWYPSSGGAGVLVDNVDYVLVDGASYNPQLQIRFLARTGYIDIYCKIPNTNIESNTIRIEVRGVIR